MADCVHSWLCLVYNIQIKFRGRLNAFVHFVERFTKKTRTHQHLSGSCNYKCWHKANIKRNTAKTCEGKKRAGKKHQNLNVWHTNLLANIFSLIVYTSEQVHMLDQLDVLLILHVIYFLYHLHFQYEFHNSECSENYSRNVNILSFKFVAFIFWEWERSYRNF